MIRNPLTQHPMSSKGKPEMVEIYKDVFVTAKELRKHEENMAQEDRAKKHPDTLSPKEEEEWEISERMRGKSKSVLGK